MRPELNPIKPRIIEQKGPSAPMASEGLTCPPDDPPVSCDQPLSPPSPAYFAKAIQKLPNEIMMKAFKDSLKNSRFGDSDLEMEIAQRKEKANREGNGVHFPLEKNSYRGLRVSHYEGSKRWRLEGEYLEKRTGQWLPFGYITLPQDSWRELWIGDHLYFSSFAQDQFVSAKLFRWAKRDGTTINPLPDGFAPLSFQRVEKVFEKSKVYSLKKGQPAIDILLGRVPRTLVTADKPHHDYYLTAPEDKSVVIVWDEMEETIEIKVFMGNNREGSPEFSGPIDDQKARGLLLIVRTLKGKTPEEKKALRDLEHKLENLSRFR